MSSELFENREDDLRTIFSDLKKKINQHLPQSSGETRKKLCRDIERGLEESNILILEMEEEARRAPSKFRMDMISSVRGYKREQEQNERDMKRATEFGNQPDTVGFYDDDDFQSVEDSQRTRLLQGGQSLNATSNSIARSHRIAAETDEIGAEIIGELGSQRESLVRTRDRLHDTDANLSRSRKILNTMSKRVMTNKLVLAVIIVLEIGILGAVVYWKFFMKKKN